MTTTTPFHDGERSVQERLGVRDIEPWARKVIRPFLPAEHRDFYAALPFLVVAARDAEGRPWATLLADLPGFVHSPEPGSLAVQARPVPGDALAEGLRPGDDVGLLGIELHSRRRNRVNGRVIAANGTGFRLGVTQSFGNCPQYIHERGGRAVEPRKPQRRVHRRLEGDARRLVEGADTFFIASGHRGRGEHASFGMDASHRGGAPGFVQVEDPRQLLFPDYAGNNHFNTLGNLSQDPRAGLVFVDFERGHLLQLTGRATVLWDAPELADFPGAQRLVRFELEEAVELRDALPLRFYDAERCSLRIVARLPESDDVTSFVLAPSDGEPAAPFAPGQYLPIELPRGEAGPSLTRTYSLSAAPDERYYRITVKRESHGAASRWLHDRLEAGDTIHARPPGGDFVLEPGERPVVLVGAGVGITPLVPMLHALRDDPGRRAVFVQGARDGRHHPLGEEIRAAVRRDPEAALHVAYSRPGSVDAAGQHYDSEGRVDAALLEKLLPGLDADFYLCGPTSFMATLRDGLEARGVPAERIRSESFGA